MATIDDNLKNKKMADSEIKITGDKSLLSGNDLKFVNFSDEVLKDYSKQQKHLFASDDILIKVDRTNQNEIEINGQKLKRITEYAVTLDANSTGSLLVTFWKNTEGSYFLMREGGCVVFRTNIYGPFRPPFL